MRRALVTGATGLVGSHIVERLQRDGWIVRALVREHADTAWLSAHHVDLALGDVLDPVPFSAAASGCEAIFHTAAAITPKGGWEAWRETNIDGTANAIEAAESSGARLLHLSSVAVYGPSGRYRGDGATTESTPLQPLPDRAYYARSKRDSEAMVLAAHNEGRIWATAVRPCVVYGPRDRQFIPRVARLFDLGYAPIIGDGSAVLAIVHAANVADGAVQAVAVDAAGGRAFNLANDHPVSVRKFAELAATGLGRRIRAVRIPLPVARAAMAVVGGVARLTMGPGMGAMAASMLDFLTRGNPFSSSDARDVLGWDPVVSPEDGVPEAFRWWAREHHT